VPIPSGQYPMFIANDYSFQGKLYNRDIPVNTPCSIYFSPWYPIKILN
jgi:hypothetical protein